MLHLPLKYSMPILIMFFGLILLFIEVKIERDIKIENMLSYENQYLTELGNHLANEIERRELVKHYNRSELIRLFSYYLAKNFKLVKIYDENFNIIFSTSSTSKTHDGISEESIYKKVQKDIKADIIIHYKQAHIVAYFPLYLPLKNGEVRRSRVGVISIVYSIENLNHKIAKDTITSAIVNSFVILSLSIILLIILYFFIFKRLNFIIEATNELKKWNFSTRVNLKGDDELTKVGNSFNEMVRELEIRERELIKYKNHLEERVKEEMIKRGEQERLLIEQSRLAQMGEMIGNIAHQWRQPLNALSILIANIKSAYEFKKLDDAYIEKSSTKANKLIQKMSHTIDDFRNFFKPDKEKKSFTIYRVLENTLSILEVSFKSYGISIDVNIDKALSSIGYPNEYSQVLMNIINNAKDALIENKIENPKIKIYNLEDSEYVILVIKDNAGGIDEKIIDRIFEPYFTTKEQGKGTGIGLYMSKTIIEEHMNGKISVKNIDNGVEFEIKIKKR